MRRNREVVLDVLDQREIDNMELLVGGLSYMEIAAVHQWHYAQVKMHFRRIFKKIGARNRGEAAYFWMSELFQIGLREYGMVTPRFAQGGLIEGTHI